MTYRDWLLLAVRVLGLYLLLQAIFAVPSLLMIAWSLCEGWVSFALFGSHSNRPFSEAWRTELATQAVGAVSRLVIYGAVGCYLIRSKSVLARLRVPEAPE